jgi:hypothetical protein
MVQPDGTFVTLISASGTGITLSGVKYSFSEENHAYAGGGPGDASFAVYDYEKIVRAGETGASFLGGDDFYIRMYLRFPTGTSGVPSDESLNTNTMAFDCR